MSAEPLHEVRFGDVRAAVWTNPSTMGTFYHVTFQSLSNKNRHTKAANGFRPLDLPVLAYTANEAFKWLQVFSVKQNGTVRGLELGHRSSLSGASPRKA